MIHELTTTVRENLKLYLCKLIGHQWKPKWHRHTHCWGLTCRRCGCRYTGREGA